MNLFVFEVARHFVFMSGIESTDTRPQWAPIIGPVCGLRAGPQNGAGLAQEAQRLFIRYDKARYFPALLICIWREPQADIISGTWDLAVHNHHIHFALVACGVNGIHVSLVKQCPPSAGMGGVGACVLDVVAELYAIPTALARFMTAFRWRLVCVVFVVCGGNRCGAHSQQACSQHRK